MHLGMKKGFISSALYYFSGRRTTVQNKYSFCMSGAALLGVGLIQWDKEPVFMSRMPGTYLSKQGWEGGGGTVLEQTRWSHSKATPHVLLFSQLVRHQTICGPVYPQTEVVVQHCARTCARDMMIITSDTQNMFIKFQMETKIVLFFVFFFLVQADPVHLQQRRQWKLDQSWSCRSAVCRCNTMTNDYKGCGRWQEKNQFWARRFSLRQPRNVFTKATCALHSLHAAAGWDLNLSHPSMLGYLLFWNPYFSCLNFGPVAPPSWSRMQKWSRQGREDLGHAVKFLGLLPGRLESVEAAMKSLNSLE